MTRKTLRTVLTLSLIQCLLWLGVPTVHAVCHHDASQTGKRYHDAHDSKAYLARQHSDRRIKTASCDIDQSCGSEMSRSVLYNRPRAESSGPVLFPIFSIRTAAFDQLLCGLGDRGRTVREIVSGPLYLWNLSLLI